MLKVKIGFRFAGTISAAFNGHTHRDQLILYHSSEDTNIPINIAWNGGSITTYSDKNPNYKIYEVDPESYVSKLVVISELNVKN